MDSKLKCVFELPVESGANPVPQENNVETAAEEKVKREVKSSPKVCACFWSKNNIDFGI